jgi:hypothetical protein
LKLELQKQQQSSPDDTNGSSLWSMTFDFAEFSVSMMQRCVCC